MYSRTSKLLPLTNKFTSQLPTTTLHQHAYQVTTSLLYFVHAYYFGCARSYCSCNNGLCGQCRSCEKRLRCLQTRIFLCSPERILRSDQNVLYWQVRSERWRENLVPIMLCSLQVVRRFDGLVLTRYRTAQGKQLGAVEARYFFT